MSSATKNITECCRVPAVGRKDYLRRFPATTSFQPGQELTSEDYRSRLQHELSCAKTRVKAWAHYGGWNMIISAHASLTAYCNSS